LADSKSAREHTRKNLALLKKDLELDAGCGADEAQSRLTTLPQTRLTRKFIPVLPFQSQIAAHSMLDVQKEPADTAM
jgi:hypothetical protein